MTQIWALSLKELKAYFASPIAYVVMAMFLLISGYFFAMILAYSKDIAMMRYLFANMTVILLLLSPLFAMRLFAEEQRNKTLELLMTSPISDAGIVMGKFLAIALLLGAMLLSTAHFPILLMVLGKPDILPILTGYLGLFLMGCSFLAIGMLTSTWTQNQIIAAVSSFSISLLLWFLGSSGSLVGAELGSLMNYLSLNSHFESFSKGVLNSSDLIYYLSVIGLLLFLTVRSLETRRWR
ncbi:ABC transporter permease [bacterium (Candidatus Blackallbacteria) CG17_big_fil_post_rev_8_21_14_2_50_48_46]|uniref:ABC transporter permease n=1 Tax=bacterium (Candidatus Blackallbacteria) CG17_big_fil_post_rev_8_21_14_2_50_48_46 TaxID=2014261 RepID=A0A2M7FWU4_9BACT|nr:MAG: ABC transporter permease [bacterium (Candidatus Blackallbacteria) CG18_big_fil_WC_8_21_14_2_50_49_26]PIW13718.1 MAG: ABC transporter permease [bacterium (Candidatus Blackallbacteria) CG17_big_fil_post_rev_8_21_14_2_50_48_46]PIW44944.1 MAG: ABC transporter permease [bacterium (Candidatus Blackallbacteria) CG13_big_fil_rev_8_21_14_2_50_49_14]